jgi:hypothetical protein
MRIYRRAFGFMLLAAVLAWSAAAYPQAVADSVSLRESTLTWSTVKYAVDADNAFIDGSFDDKTIVDRSFKTYILENRYLRVTLLPEFGGRILSIIYKPTGHEQLYRSEVGVPYGMKGGVFYYDWMMVLGGIFPTFPDAEHGKTWPKPWAFKVVKESAEEVTVSMSFTDDFDFVARPRQFGPSTGLEATYIVTLKAGRAALDTRVVLKNPQRRSITYEYWTCATLAPGSDPARPQATGGAEIIAPIAAYVTPRWSANIAAGDADAGEGRHRFERLRYFRNWPTMGIAYAAPDMGGGNFWGVINHDNDEGIFRIADNRQTPGLKMWTWGFPSLANASIAREKPDPAQPYVELWAGVTDQFFHGAAFPPLGEVTIPETWIPSVGMRNVTHANENILLNLSAETSSVNLQIFSTDPSTPLRVRMKHAGAVLIDTVVQPDSVSGNAMSAVTDGKPGDRVQVTIETADGKHLIGAETAIR